MMCSVLQTQVRKYKLKVRIFITEKWVFYFEVCSERCSLCPWVCIMTEVILTPILLIRLRQNSTGYTPMSFIYPILPGAQI